MSEVVAVYTDGASKGNPGPASIGVVCFVGNAQSLNSYKEAPDELFSISKAVGKKTNNEAEYMSLIAALEELTARSVNAARIYMDSELVVRQMNGIYKVKNERLKPLFLRVSELSRGKQYKIEHIPRDKNQIADYLANLALAKPFKDQ